MAKEDGSIELQGTVLSVLPDAMFRVKLQNEHVILAYTSGRMKKSKIKVVVGDVVTVVISPYDTSRGRITRRLREISTTPPSEI